MPTRTKKIACEATEEKGEEPPQDNGKAEAAATEGDKDAEASTAEGGGDKAEGDGDKAEGDGDKAEGDGEKTEEGNEA